MPWLSVSKSTSDDDAHHKYFEAVPNPSMKDLARIILECARWSPIVWEKGERKGANFKSCDYLVLDFDNGEWSAEVAAKFFRGEGTKFIIASTRSHRIAKDGGEPHDRYRVVMPFDGRISDLRTYEQNMKRILAHFPCDQACKDGARMYRYSLKILAFGDGDPVPWFPYEAPKPISESERARRAVYHASGSIPRWAQDVLSSGAPSGSRNQTIFRLAANLYEYGVSESDIYELIRQAPFDIPDNEREAAIRSGITNQKGRPV